MFHLAFFPWPDLHLMRADQNRGDCDPPERVMRTRACPADTAEVSAPGGSPLDRATADQAAV